MKDYSIAFVGMGSIGCRHIRNVCYYLNSKGISFTIDVYDIKKQIDLPEESLFHIRKRKLWDDEIPSEEQYDIVFVTNPTSMHFETMRRFKNHTRAFFVEKPVFASTEIDTEIFKEFNKTVCYVACPLRYNPVLRYLRDNINYKEAISVRAISSSYLPDWRPGRDYRQCYSAHRELGGGVDIDLIHEWDYITYLWGMPDKTFSIREHISNLEIDSNDIAIYIAKAGKTTIELHLDYFGRKNIRFLELFMPDDTIHCDINEGKILFLKSGKSIKLEVDRNEFQMREIEHFFSIIDGKIENDSTIEHGFSLLKIAGGDI